MSVKRISGKDLSSAITSDDILGKEVIDESGQFIGIVEKVFVDPESLELLGVEIDKGFLRKGLQIGRDYLDRVTPYAVFLSIRVAYELKGMRVFDNSGGLIGTVSSVVLQSERNEISALEIKPSSGLFSKKIIVPGDKIASVGYSVFLNISREQLK